jgi:predicted ABC-type ATPase
MNPLFWIKGRRRRADWDESKHPRADDGKFGPGGGGGTATEEPPDAEPEPTETEQPAPETNEPQPETETPPAETSQPQETAPSEAPKPEKAKPHTSKDAPKGKRLLATDYDGPVADWATEASKGKDSERVFKDENGDWNPERQKLHREMLDTVLAKAKKQKNPVFHLMGGGPASGKSSILDAGLVESLEDDAYIDPDEMKFGLPEMRDMVEQKDKRAAAFSHEESSSVSKMALAEATKKGTNITLDGTGDGGIQSLRKKILPAREAGHRIVGSYVTIPTDEAVRRAEERGKGSGRVVPVDQIRQTHIGVSKVFPQAVEEGLFDEVELYDNSGPKGSQPVKIFEHRDGKSTIHDQAAYEAFLAKGEESWQNQETKTSSLTTSRRPPSRRPPSQTSPRTTPRKSTKTTRAARTSSAQSKWQPSPRKPRSAWRTASTPRKGGPSASTWMSSSQAQTSSLMSGSEGLWFEGGVPPAVAGYEQPEACTYGPDVYGYLDEDKADDLGEILVPIAEVRGSAIKTAWPSIDDDECQYFLEAWIEGEYDTETPLDAIAVDGEFWIWDGHSRFVVNRAMNPTGEILLHVTERFPGTETKEARIIGSDWDQFAAGDHVIEADSERCGEILEIMDDNPDMMSGYVQWDDGEAGEVSFAPGNFTKVGAGSNHPTTTLGGGPDGSPSGETCPYCGATGEPHQDHLTGGHEEDCPLLHGHEPDENEFEW